MANSQPARWTVLSIVVISVSVVGYFVGLQSPMNPPGGTTRSATSESAELPAATGDTIPATDYAEMRFVRAKMAEQWLTRLSDLKSSIDPNATIVITEEQKRFALAMREQNRAFNGAPPTIPHPIDQVSAESCMVCHGQGARTESLRIPRMSHQFLANCTQCHVESAPSHMQPVVFRESTFVGLPAPRGGPRAFPTAPPMIPHSTWMRVDCTSCHGPTGQHGIRTTHPWRRNCQQCHAPSSKLDQVPLDTQPRFVSPPEIPR